jgi:hypothetical protein
MMESDQEFPLPFDPEFLVPFVVAWRSTPSELPAAQRATLASAQMTAWGLPLPEDVVEGAAAYMCDALRLDTAYGVANHRHLIPNDKSCCVCGCSALALRELPGELRVWEVVKREVLATEYERACLRCGTRHCYSHVRTPAAGIVLLVEDTRRKPLRCLSLERALTARLGVSCRYAKRGDGDPDLLLLRGFDHPPAGFQLAPGPPGEAPPECELIELSAQLSAQLSAADVERAMPPSAARRRERLGGEVVRYRTNVLSLPVFAPFQPQSRSANKGRHVFTAELLELTAAAMERTQVSFVGMAEVLTRCRVELDRLSESGPAVVAVVPRKPLEASFMERELLLSLTEAGLPFPPADHRWAAGGTEDYDRQAERTLLAATPLLKQHFRSFWCLQHDQRCVRRGNCRLLVMDGNAKIYRRCCSQRYRFYDVLPGYGYVHRGCTARPAPGFYDCVECLASTAQASPGAAPCQPCDAEDDAVEAEARERRPAYIAASGGESAEEASLDSGEDGTEEASGEEDEGSDAYHIGGERCAGDPSRFTHAGSDRLLTVSEHTTLLDSTGRPLAGVWWRWAQGQ